MAKLRHLFGEFRFAAQFLGPGMHARMQPRERITGERQPVLVDQPSDVEHAQIVAHQIGPLREFFLQRVELGTKFQCRSARPLVGKTFLGGPLPELDLDLLFMIARALHGAGAVGHIAFQRGLRLRRAGRREHEAEAQGAQIEMQVVLVPQQRRHLALVARRNQPRRGESPFQILDDVVALDMHRAVMHQHRHQPARIDAEKPWLHVFVSGQVDRMRLPRYALEVEEDAQLLRARRAHEVQHVHALPAQHLAGLDVAVRQLNHETPLHFSRPS